MKQLLITYCLIIASLVSSAQRTSTFPSPTGFVNDFENDFTPEQAKDLNYAVKDLLAKTMDKDSLKGLEMAVVTVTGAMFGDEKEMGDYATRLGDKWGLGTRSGNRGIIIAYSKKLRKVTIIAGTGLDNLLPAKECNIVINEKMLPQFKKGDYYKAILDAIKGISDYLSL